MQMEANGSAPSPAPAPARRAFQGRLENVSLFEILGSLATAGTNGVLFIEGPPPGLIVFDDGEVRTASRAELEGATALTQLLLLTRGRFQFLASRQAVDVPRMAPTAATEGAETFGARALRALDGARSRLFAPRPEGLLEIPRTRDTASPVAGD